MNVPVAPLAPSRALTRESSARDPLWYKDAIIYQLHVKSFADSNNDGIGDFPGLISKLDYLADLGVNTLWLLPFYPSPRRDDGYDIADYRNVHPEYGVMADVRRFIAAAHKKGMRVITELVINHTSDQHPWFQRARKAKPGSVFRDFYVWSDTDEKYRGTRIIFLDTERSNWTWDPVARAYFWHRFYSHQPDLNFDNPKVVEAVLSVMRFWLDIGVDGLRLDAVPYLVEREGTINENLPETHAMLKRIRAELDARYPDRMLLAEANQWPEDTKDYFGQGDECHMAFHFPLMPRMYMALAREDRFPITDIMRQTPQIPDNCQWAIFLRNHDELTLEMVTDSERDYLWQTYATDRRARINLGIRRRLAPLLERDRRRIEMLNCLLLSMPGAPVIYYGDEIGMGDNIRLGDRDGVRTPMQWSPDRNGGFSRADPAALALPSIMDPLYGYDAVNVEAQTRDPHSLLHWMRRMLAIRRQHPAFGRGTLRFLYPRNRKVLVYLRCHEDETILCVANVARTPQAVEIDLSEFVGHVPVELSGGSLFPPIGQLTYLLTLPPYGFYWFVLAPAGEPPSWHTPAPEPLPDYVTIVLRDGLEESLLESPALRDALPAYLAKRRWFAAKDQAIKSARLASVTRVPDGERTLLLAEIAAQTDGGISRWLLPLSILWEDEPQAALPTQLAVARVRKGRRVGLLTDAFALPDFALHVLSAMADGTRLKSSDGEIVFDATPGMEDVLRRAPDATVMWLTAEQSNSSLIVDDAAMLKIFRRVSAGEHPEAEMSRHLTRQGFANAPPLLGEVVRVGEDGARHSLAVAQAFVRNQGDAWTWTLNHFNRVLDDLATHEASEEARADKAQDYYDVAANIGRQLATMHSILARPSDNEAFAPVRASSKDISVWIKRTGSLLDSAFRAIANRIRGDDPALEAAADRLRKQRAALLKAAAELARRGEGTLMTRVHGDFHLGQVLVVSGDAYIIDFEGEPGLPLAQRRAKSSPLIDAAGLLRSLDYAVGAVTDPKNLVAARLSMAARDAFIARLRAGAERAFLEAYREGVNDLPNIGGDALLDFFLLQKAAYEIGYEAANRPTWLHIPLHGLSRLADRLVLEVAA
ncbi:MAG: maltose alpha-D-glucosyltransferase [Alphaproteobacteria bacterium]|nr:maltose alpha-D-glucosyltransferase [Alphaproteobacteria bacterium]MCW5744321.1 maltose alpha-D-glucosyltransferase [Alphaproteobacteria bacterium]